MKSPREPLIKKSKKEKSLHDVINTRYVECYNNNATYQCYVKGLSNFENDEIRKTEVNIIKLIIYLADLPELRPVDRIQK